ncbi:hypothetical protein [Legionella hackeliae]|uniref:hypothetical protein n=1 Tax=Legionella hackeliae TaxID=449 RepID=UPI0011C050F1|nr:hypothetical protein [Legionella hackeliae]
MIAANMKLTPAALHDEGYSLNPTAVFKYLKSGEVARSLLYKASRGISTQNLRFFATRLTEHKSLLVYLAQAGGIPRMVLSPEDFFIENRQQEPEIHTPVLN